MTGTYLLAGVAIRIESLYDEVQLMCSDYRTDLTPEIFIATTPQDIEHERLESREQQLADGLTPADFPPSYLETLAVYRQIASQLLSYGILLMHGSVIAVDGQAYMFTAKSGTGKSTHVRLWRRLFGERAVMVNDDKPLIRVQPDAITVYGTPWDGKHHLSNNIHTPLRAIVELHRGEQNRIEPIDAKDAFVTLLQQTHRPNEPQQVIATLQLLSLLAQQVGLFRLYCNMQPEAAQVAYEGIARFMAPTTTQQ